jgi:hypothetical protein
MSADTADVGALSALDACLGGASKLDLKGLDLASIPDCVVSQLPSLPHVRHVDLSLNPSLDRLPDDLGLATSVTTLFALGCGFESVSLVLSRLPRLGMLSFKSNRLSQVPEAALPPSVFWLILTDNRLTRLPASLGRLAGLRKLMLSNNRLASLPDEILSCLFLELVRLSDNRLTKLPDGLFTALPRLAWVALAGNPCVAAAQARVGLPLEVSMSELEMKEEIGRGAGGTVHRAVWRRQGGVGGGGGGDGGRYASSGDGASGGDGGGGVGGRAMEAGGGAGGGDASCESQLIGRSGSSAGGEDGSRGLSGGECVVALPFREEQVALKLFRASATVSDGDPLHEIEASGALSHPSMV